jgi:hypothetical protein
MTTNYTELIFSLLLHAFGVTLFVVYVQIFVHWNDGSLIDDDVINPNEEIKRRNIPS